MAHEQMTDEACLRVFVLRAVKNQSKGMSYMQRICCIGSTQAQRVIALGIERGVLVRSADPKTPFLFQVRSDYANEWR